MGRCWKLEREEREARAPEPERQSQQRQSSFCRQKSAEKAGRSGPGRFPAKAVRCQGILLIPSLMYEVIEDFAGLHSFFSV